MPVVKGVFTELLLPGLEQEYAYLLWYEEIQRLNKTVIAEIFEIGMKRLALSLLLTELEALRDVR